VRLSAETARVDCLPIPPSPSVEVNAGDARVCATWTAQTVLESHILTGGETARVDCLDRYLHTSLGQEGVIGGLIGRQGGIWPPLQAVIQPAK